jgi:hypothetical protein
MLKGLSWAVIVCVAALLSACNTQNTLSPGTGNPGVNSPISGVQQIQPPAQQIDARVAVAPVVGTTVTAASELARRLSTDAQARGLKFVPSDESGATHILKGYFSAFGEDGKTTVVFVWDLLDPQGNRLHRIQGQETVAANGGADPWSVVPPETMQAIADRTIDALVPWFTRSSG